MVSRPGPPLSERVVDMAAVAFAIWTLSCHAVVWAGGSLYDAMAAFAVGSCALAAVGVWWRSRDAGQPPPPLAARPLPLAAPPAAGETLPPDSSGRKAQLLRAGLFCFGVVGAVVLRGDLVAFWWLAVVLLGLAWALFVMREPIGWAEPARGRGLEAGLVGICLACVAIALAAHRVDLDDAFYINLAAAAADDPHGAILAGDTLHGVAGLPLHLPVYRLHSYEMWNAALSALTGIPAIACFHLVSAALGAVLAPLALARLLRRITPERWLLTLAVMVFVLVAVGETHRWYGNFAFVRIWQGKGFFLFVFLPLIQSYALDLVRRPGSVRWLRLALAQVAAVGFTSSALWAAPVAALVAAASGLRPSRRHATRLALVLLSSLYVLGVGWSAKRAFEADRVVGITAELTPEVEQVRRERNELVRHTAGAELEIALGLVAGDSRLRSVILAALVAAWALCPAGLARRYAVVVPLAVTLVLLDPYTTRWVTGNLTGPSFWRAFWVLPIPLLLALALTAPLSLPWGPRWLRLGASAAACLAFALTVPSFGGLSRENNVVLALPGLKVDEESYRWAELLTQRVVPGDVVVAPGDVCVWLATFRGRAQPLLVRPGYLSRYVKSLGAEELDLRLLMTNYATGYLDAPADHERFGEGLERFGVRAVLLRDSPFAAHARAILRAAGFEPDLKALDHEIWLRR